MEQNEILICASLSLALKKMRQRLEALIISHS